jgi:acyl-CoA thioester hydrolase
MFIWPVRVYYEDTDSGGVVYYANYLKFMERARSEWLRSLGHEQDVLAERYGVLFAVQSVALDFLKPARFNELLHVSAIVTHIGGASLRFKQEVSRIKQGRGPEVLTQGRVSVVCLDVRAFKPMAIPPHLKKDLESAG